MSGTEKQVIEMVHQTVHIGQVGVVKRFVCPFEPYRPTRPKGGDMQITIIAIRILVLMFCLACWWGVITLIF